MSTEVHRRRRRAPRGRGPPRTGWASSPISSCCPASPHGLVLCALAYFRKGSGLMAAALLFGALARLLLPESQLGHLAVRSRPVDCWTLVILGEMVAFVALSVPPMNKTGLLLAGVFGVLIALALGVRAVRFLLAERRAGRSGPSEEPGSSAGTGQV